MLISTIISIVVFVVYVTATLTKFKTVPESLSNTYYMLGKWGPLFTLMMFACAFTILPPMLELTNPNFQFVAFFCPAAICFVGAAPNFKKDQMECKVHTISAYVSAIAGLLWVAFLTRYWWLIPISIVIIGLLAYLTKTMQSTKTWWLEMVAFLAVYSALLIGVWG